MHLRLNRRLIGMAAGACLIMLSAQGAGQEGAAPTDPITTALSAPCRIGKGLAMLVSPERPLKGKPMRVLAVSNDPRPGALLVGDGPAGRHKLKVLSRSGPPYWWFAELKAPARGRHRFVLANPDGKVLACRRPRVEARAGKGPETPADGVWPIKRRWNWVTEAVYSAWIEKLFDAPPTERPGWTPLHKATRDPARNFLYNHLGAKEDGPKARKAVVLRPDCADLPYFLRGYFAWKMRLPFGYRHCDRGSSKRATRCGELRHIISERSPAQGADPARRFSQYMRRKVSYVHSGSGRTAPDDNESDLYPLKLTRRNLRPGTVYVDPYGHLLVVSRWINQQGDKSGQLFAVDGHPDLSVGRKRFWRGAFLFSDNVKGTAGGFKAFRPLVKREGSLVPLTNEELNADKNYGNQSDEQYRLGIDGFYDRMDRVINPKPLSPLAAHKELLKALFELIMERVDSVAAGEKYMKSVSYRTMKMPRGPRIFETSGPWEDFSTPARDFRLLIAMDEVTRFPDKVVSHPDRFAMPAGTTPQQARLDLLAQHKSFTAAHSFTYVMSDGASRTLTMAQLLGRQKEMELAYNPNDCVELRWAAKGEELKTCKRHAPSEQRNLMMKYRPWFAKRYRPPIR